MMRVLLFAFVTGCSAFSVDQLDPKDAGVWCQDVFFEASPPNCNELSWCEKHGFTLEDTTECVK